MLSGPAPLPSNPAPLAERPRSRAGARRRTSGPALPYSRSGARRPPRAGRTRGPASLQGQPPAGPILRRENRFTATPPVCQAEIPAPAATQRILWAAEPRSAQAGLVTPSAQLLKSMIAAGCLAPVGILFQPALSKGG